MRSAKILVVGFLVSAVGCGSDGFNPSAPGGTRIGDLSPDQGKTLCIETVSYVQSVLSPAARVEYACRMEGIQATAAAGSNPTDADIQAFCKVGYDACKRNPPVVPPDPAPATQCAGGLTNSEGCPATIDQFTACVNETVDAYPRYIVPCSQLTRAKVLALALAEQGPACRTIETLCPDQAASALMTSSSMKSMKSR